MEVIEVRDVGKRYRRPTIGRRTVRDLSTLRPGEEHWALRDVSFTVTAGETVGLVGPNGSGKSTLLRLVAGLSRPTAGTVVVRQQVSGLLTLGEGFQALLSGEENALTGAILAGLTRREAKRRLPAIAAFAELEDHMDQPLRTFSDGMRLRLAFSVAVHVDPELLLIDEILAVGDLRFRERCLGRLEELKGRGVTVVLASHDLSQVRRLCQRALWLSEGTLRLDAPADEVADVYHLAMHAPPEPAAPGDAIRLGGREVEVIAVRVLDHRGRPTDRIPAGGPFAVEIDFDAHEHVSEAIFGVSAHMDGGATRCFDLSTLADGCWVGPLDGPGTVRLDVERLDLSGGLYQLSVGIYRADWSGPYDYLWEAVPLVVGGPEEPGLLAPPHKWTIT